MFVVTFLLPPIRQFRSLFSARHHHFKQTAHAHTLIEDRRILELSDGWMGIHFTTHVLRSLMIKFRAGDFAIQAIGNRLDPPVAGCMCVRVGVCALRSSSYWPDSHPHSQWNKKTVHLGNRVAHVRRRQKKSRGKAPFTVLISFNERFWFLVRIQSMKYCETFLFNVQSEVGEGLSNSLSYCNLIHVLFFW